MINNVLDQDVSIPTLDEIRGAAERLYGVATRTPLLENRDVNRQLGGRLLVKCENMQRTGAFKFRGAYNRISQMDAAQKARGVITYSSGNHAQGVALAAQILGTSAVIVMPKDAPEAKIIATRELGAVVVFFDRDTQSSDDVVSDIQAKTNRINVPPSADRRVLAGGGTVALEMLEQARAQEAKIDTVLVPCGGGGVTAATAFVMEALEPDAKVYSAEPALFDDTRRSLLAGERVGNPSGQKTICDAIMTPIPNSLTFSVNNRLLAGGVTATDDEVRTAMLFAFEHFKIVVEPGAAVGLAAVLNRKTDIKGMTVVVIVTGGNIAAENFTVALSAAKSEA